MPNQKLSELAIMCNIKQSDIETIIDGLEEAIRICYNVDNTSDDHERSYPFAAGYSRAAMQTAVGSLRSLMWYNR